MSSGVLSENKLIRRSIDNHVKLKEEEDDTKPPAFGEQTADFLKSGTVMRFKLGLVKECVIASRCHCIWWVTCSLTVVKSDTDIKIGM